MRLYGTRASEFELLAETEPVPEVRLRYRIIARHYRELANREQCSASHDGHLPLLGRRIGVRLLLRILVLRRCFDYFDCASRS